MKEPSEAMSEHPDLLAGVVECRACKRRKCVDTPSRLRRGWPKCCGETMRLLAVD